MQYAFYTVPTLGGAEQQELLNRFLRSQKIVKVDKQLVEMSEQFYWAFCITYMPSQPTESGSGLTKEKVDYRNGLDENAFRMFSSLRSLRKEIARQDAVPAYAVFTDAELAAMTQLETFDIKHVLSINGIGQKRAEKYALAMIEAYNNMTFVQDDETGG